ARMLIRHRKPPKLRQLAPPAVMPAVGLALLAPWSVPLSLWAAAPAAAWLALCLGYGLALGARERRPCACAAGVAAAIMHLAWSAGFWSHVLAGPRTEAAQQAPARG